MNTIKVNILPNPKMEKPGSKEYGKIQKIICNDENIQVLDFKHFAYLVGEKGYMWKSALLQGGAKNENFKEAYILSLDFDEGMKINDFLNISKDLGLEPTFIYQTFSHTDENHRFRAIWRLNEIITMPQLKTALQLMLMEIFSECDSACKDLSRLWVGGKKVAYYNGENTLNLENLLNSLVNTINKNSTNGHESRNIKAFCKKIGINIYNKYPFVLKSGENHENSYNIIYRELRENSQKINTFIYDNMEFSFDTNSYNSTKATCKGAKIQSVKGEKVKKTKIDFDKLSSRCKLFNDFIIGNRLEHNEIKHLSFNLYEFEKYPTLLEETLLSHKYNNYENKYNTYVSAMNYNYKPTQCGKVCKYYNECMNPKNIKEKYYQKDSKVKVLGKEPTITLAEAERELSEVPSVLNEMTSDDILLLKAVTGIGKTELLKVLSLENVIIGVPNHKLGEETFSRLSEINPNLLYVKPINTEHMPLELKFEIQRYYDLGIPGEVKNKVFEEIKTLNELGMKGNKFPQYYYDLIEYVEQLEQIPNADSLLFTHHRISYGNSNNKIDTIILDEDFLKSFIKYGSACKSDLLSDLNKLLIWAKEFQYEREKLYNKELVLDDYLEFFNAIYDFERCASLCNGSWFENPLRIIAENPRFRSFIVQYIKSNKDNLNTDIFKLIKSEYVSVKQNQYIHMVNGEAIKELSNYKVIVMSATIDDDIHPGFIHKYLPGKNIIFKNIANTELMGNIYCDCSYSWSRDGLRNTSLKSIDKLEKILNDDRYNNIISFMDNDLIDVEKYGKKKITHFGATEGIDKYKGENLCIIGTPHNNSALYEAYGVLLTGKSPLSDTWKVKRVKKYGFEFDLNTYENEADYVFTKIQLYFLYSELIQAVGRARALRFKADVYVHSALPLPNSILI